MTQEPIHGIEALTAFAINAIRKCRSSGIGQLWQRQGADQI